MFGTLFGVLIGDLLILTINIKWLLIAGVFAVPSRSPSASNAILDRDVLRDHPGRFVFNDPRDRARRHARALRASHRHALRLRLSGAVTLASAALARLFRPRAETPDA